MTNPAVYPPGKSSKLLWITLAGVTLIVAAAIVVIALMNRQSNSSETVSNVAQQNKEQTNRANTNSRNDDSPSTSTGTENKNPENANARSGTETVAQDLRGLQKYVGKYAGDMFEKEDGLRERLTNLLGSNYKLFMGRWDVTSPIEDHGGILFAEGCMAHACTAEESLLAIDTTHGIIYCAILSDLFGGRFKTFSEGNGSLPPVMKDKMQEIMNIK